MRMTRLRYMNCSFGCEWLAKVLRQYLRGLARKSGVATVQDLGAKLFGAGAKRKGFHPKPEAHVLAGTRGRAISCLLFESWMRSRQAASAPADRKTLYATPSQRDLAEAHNASLGVVR